MQLRNSIQQLLSSIPNGGKAFVDDVQQAYEKFTGNALNRSKAEVLASFITGSDNKHVLTALGADTQAQSKVETLREQMVALCNREWDHGYDNRYFDFFQPLCQRRALDSDAEIVIGLWTTLEFDDDNDMLVVSQSVRGNHSHYDEFNYCSLQNKGYINTETRGADLTYRPEYVDEEVVNALVASEIKGCHVTGLSWQRGNPQHAQMNMHTLMLSLATMELRRLTTIIGQAFEMDMSFFNDQEYIFKGAIPYQSL